METQDWTQKLKKALPSAVLEVRPFGRGGEASVWVEMKSMLEVARYLKSDESLQLDWLECLSVMEMDGALVLSYFLRSSATSNQVVVRGTVVPSFDEAEVEVPSVASVWPMAQMMEQENWDLFGVHFGPGEKKKKVLLPEGWIGYPLRKSYVFPTEFSGIPHMRPVGQTGPDEYRLQK